MGKYTYKVQKFTRLHLLSGDARFVPSPPTHHSAGSVCSLTLPTCDVFADGSFTAREHGYFRAEVSLQQQRCSYYIANILLCCYVYAAAFLCFRSRGILFFRHLLHHHHSIPTSHHRDRSVLTRERDCIISRDREFDNMQKQQQQSVPHFPLQHVSGARG